MKRESKKRRMRLDKFLHNSRKSESIEKAKKEILTGWVKVNGETVRVPSKKVTGEETIEVQRPGGNFVSRGGIKLQHALNYFNISVKGIVTADLGSSTGGFTDCLLQNGAKKIYSIDVGYGLLDYRLRTDSRVIVKDKTNVRNLNNNDFVEKVDFITSDLSFISITKVFDDIKAVFSPVQGVFLLKPQFEARNDEHEKGIVKNKQDHKTILTRVVDTLMKSGMIFKGLHFSPIKGPSGNIEFLLHCEIQDNCSNLYHWDDIKNKIDNVVDEAHLKLNI